MVTSTCLAETERLGNWNKNMLSGMFLLLWSVSEGSCDLVMIFLDVCRGGGGSIAYGKARPCQPLRCNIPVGMLLL